LQIVPHPTLPVLPNAHASPGKNNFEPPKYELRRAGYLFSCSVLGNLLLKKLSLQHFALVLMLFQLKTWVFDALLLSHFLPSHSLQVESVESILRLGVKPLRAEVKRCIRGPISIARPRDSSAANVLHNHAA
jgi:hypothetical protein